MSEKDEKKVKIEIEKEEKETEKKGKHSKTKKEATRREESQKEMTKSKTTETKKKEKEEYPKTGEMEVIEKIHIKKKIPKEYQYEINREILKNLLIATAIILLMLCFHLGFINIPKENFIIDLRFFSVLLLVISIILFEKSYKKDNGKYFVYGIEILILAILILFLPYFYFHCKDRLARILIAISPAFFGIYYCVKGIIIEHKMRKKYKKESNDIKEIVKKDKKKREEKKND